MKRELFEKKLMMKQWAIRIFIALTVLFVLTAGALFIFVKTTLNETSIALLEEKISKSYDPYTTTFNDIVLEEGSLVKNKFLTNC